MGEATLLVGVHYPVFQKLNSGDQNVDLLSCGLFIDAFFNCPRFVFLFKVACTVPSFVGVLLLNFVGNCVLSRLPRPDLLARCNPVGVQSR